MTEELFEFVAIVAALYGALCLLLRWRGQTWTDMPTQQRRPLHWMVGLGVVLILVTEDVLTRASSRVDAALMSWIHVVVPEPLTPIFQALTLSASAKVVFPVLAVAVAALLIKRRYWECAVLASSLLGSVALVYLAKTAIQRVRPAVWETQWYWGSSFPSGHTLTAAALATAVYLCAERNWPLARWPFIALAALWALLVALSRLVLGVHWPTDVLAALCAGVLLALGVAAAITGIEASRSAWIPTHKEKM